MTSQTNPQCPICLVVHVSRGGSCADCTAIYWAIRDFYEGRAIEFTEDQVLEKTRQKCRIGMLRYLESELGGSHGPTA
jgi:hypothetical protein